MTHDEAIRVKAAEQYALGELPQPIRDEFEDHFFDCEECALDVKAAAAFVDNARAVWRFAA
jgi:anti-sigma factor RsiW